MKQLTLSAITPKARKILSRLGVIWEIHAHTETVLFNPEKGPWFYIAPIGQGHTSKNAMWIKEFNDQNYKIILNDQ